MSKEVSKGMLALRQSKQKAERVVIDGTTFYFRKLTIAMEDDLEKIIQSHQNPDLKPPQDPGPTATLEERTAFNEAVAAFIRVSERGFRRLTADLMKYILLDESDKPLFDVDDDVYSELDNVYAKRFYRAFTEFRNGTAAGAGGAERRFQD